MLDNFRSSLAFKIAAANLLGVILLCGFSLVAIQRLLVADFTRQAVEAQDLSMRIAWDAIRTWGGTFRADSDRLLLGDMVLNGNYEIIDQVKRITGGTATIFRGDTRISTNVPTNDGSRAVGTKLAPGPVYDAVLKRGESFRGVIRILGEDYFGAYDPIKDASGSVVGILYVGIKKANVFKSFDANMTVGALSISGLAVLLAAPGYLLLRRQIRPLLGLCAAMEALSRGDLKAAIAGAERRDEIGAMARAVQVFRDAMSETERLRAQHEEAKRQAEADQRRALYALADDLEGHVEAVVEHVASASSEMNATAHSMAAVAEQVTRQSAAAAAAAEETSVNVQTVATAAEQLSASVAEIAQQMTVSTQVTERASERAQRSSGIVAGLNTAVQKIGEVVGLINSIAAQTNLLALNATIEAARAGEAGKGFAVVASEVKALANQTAKATEEIAGQVNSVQEATGQAVGTIHGIQETIADICRSAATIASAVEQQRAATGEIARNVERAAAGTRSVADNIAGVSQSAAEGGRAAEQVLREAAELAQQSESLRSKVNGFIDKVRA